MEELEEELERELKKANERGRPMPKQMAMVYRKGHPERCDRGMCPGLSLEGNYMQSYNMTLGPKNELRR